LTRYWQLAQSYHNFKVADFVILRRSIEFFGFKKVFQR
jgi:hypothetical protein